jgi:hypothetical protein
LAKSTFPVQRKAQDRQPVHELIADGVCSLGPKNSFDHCFKLLPAIALYRAIVREHDCFALNCPVDYLFFGFVVPTGAAEGDLKMGVEVSGGHR